MDVTRLKHLSPEDRHSILEGECISSQEKNYTKPVNEEELAYYKDQLANRSVDQAVLLDELNRFKEAHKIKADPIKKDISEALQAIKFKAIDTFGKLYNVPDYDLRIMHIIDSEGNVINSRPLLPEERQYKMPMLNREAV